MKEIDKLELREHQQAWQFYWPGDLITRTAVINLWHCFFDEFAMLESNLTIFLACFADQQKMLRPVQSTCTWPYMTNGSDFTLPFW
jgi:hypothetical protein